MKISDDRPFELAWWHYERSKGEKSESYRKKLAIVFRAFSFCHKTPMKEVDEKMVKKAILSLSERQSPLTYQKNVRIARDFFQFLVERGWYAANPLQPYVISTPKTKQFFTPERLKIIAKLASPYLKGALGILYYTGCPLNALRSLIRHRNGWVGVQGRLVPETARLSQILDENTYYNYHRVRREFRDLMSQVDFPGTLTQVSNAYYARLVLEGAGAATFRGMGFLQPEAKIKSLGLETYTKYEEYDDFF